MKYALSGYENINLGGTAGFKLLSHGTEIVSWAGVFLFSKQGLGKALQDKSLPGQDARIEIKYITPLRYWDGQEAAVSKRKEKILWLKVKKSLTKSILKKARCQNSGIISERI